MTEWNAASCHKVSGPQTSWGQKVLSRLSVHGDERAIDAGREVVVDAHGGRPPVAAQFTIAFAQPQRSTTRLPTE